MPAEETRRDPRSRPSLAPTSQVNRSAALKFAVTYYETRPTRDVRDIFNLAKAMTVYIETGEVNLHTVYPPRPAPPNPNVKET